MRCVAWIVRLKVCVLVAGLLSGDVALGQMWSPPSERIAVDAISGVYDQPGSDYAEVYKVRVDGGSSAGWVRLRISDAHLDGDSHIRIESVQDGAVQHLRAEHLLQWRMSSAYFNGSAVDVSLVVAPNTVGNYFAIEAMDIGVSDPTAATICDTVDDRVASDVPAVGRLQPAGCTGTLYNTSSCSVTAGHCLNINDVVEFNVPPSLPDGTNQHPGPEDQYAMVEQVGVANGVGNDWGHYRVFENTETGMTPFEAQGEFIPLANSLPALPVDIQIVGYGVDGGVDNSTQQISFGPVLSLAGSVGHRADTRGGNSGSLIVDDATGLGIGIHTHGGCNTDPESVNSGTLITIAGFQDQVLDCLGVTLDFPEGVPDLVSPDGATQVVVSLSSLDDTVVFESVVLMVRVADGDFESQDMVPDGEGLFVGALPAADCGVVVSYFIAVETNVGVDLREPSEGSLNAVVGDTLRVVHEDDFESPVGYEVSGDADDGEWTVGVPVGCNRGDPPSDFDGSGRCWLTDNNPNACNSDVDDGETTLTTPVLDMGEKDGIYFVRYARWYSNTAGANPNADIFEVEISNDGGASWTLLETVGPDGPEAGGGWVNATHRVDSVIEPTNAMRLRFTASDSVDEGSVVEAGIDALGVDLVVCSLDDLAPMIVHDGGVTTSPFSGYIDPRQESSDGVNFDLGIQEISILFSEPVRDVASGPSGELTVNAFSIATGAGEMMVVSVDASENPLVRLGLSFPLFTGGWTTVVADVEDMSGNRIDHLGDLGPNTDEPDRIDIGYLPGDVDQSGGVQALDLLRFRQALSGVFVPEVGSMLDYFDTDRNGTVQALDFLRFRQLLLGSGNATQVWQGVEIPTRP